MNKIEHWKSSADNNIAVVISSGRILRLTLSIMLLSIVFIPAVLALFCPRCGRENTAGVRFCSFCGLPVQEVFNYVKFLENKEKQVRQIMGSGPSLTSMSSPEQPSQSSMPPVSSSVPVSSAAASSNSSVASGQSSLQPPVSGKVASTSRSPVKGMVHSSQKGQSASAGQYEPVRQSAPSAGRGFSSEPVSSAVTESASGSGPEGKVSDLFGARFESMDNGGSTEQGSSAADNESSATGSALAGEKAGEGSVVILMTYKKKGPDDIFNRPGKVYINSAFVGDILPVQEEKKDYGFDSKLFGKLSSYSDEIHYKFARNDIPEGVYQVKVAIEQKGFLRNVSKYKVFDNVEVKAAQETRLLYQWNSRTSFGK